jgi:hypothetical protein
MDKTQIILDAIDDLKQTMNKMMLDDVMPKEEEITEPKKGIEIKVEEKKADEMSDSDKNDLLKEYEKLR